MVGGSLVEGTVAAVTVPAVRLFPFLQARYSDSTLANICVLKIDTEVDWFTPGSDGVFVNCFFLDICSVFTA